MSDVWYGLLFQICIYAVFQYGNQFGRRYIAGKCLAGSNILPVCHFGVKLPFFILTEGLCFNGMGVFTFGKLKPKRSKIRLPFIAVKMVSKAAMYICFLSFDLDFLSISGSVNILLPYFIISTKLFSML